MKSKIIKAVALSALAVAALLITGHVLAAGNTDSGDAAVSPAAEETGCTYTVREFDGKLAVFTEEFLETPAIITEISADGLRAYDKALLEKGIPVATYEEVLRLFEDFGP